MKHDTELSHGLADLRMKADDHGLGTHSCLQECTAHSSRQARMDARQITVTKCNESLEQGPVRPCLLLRVVHQGDCFCVDLVADVRGGEKAQMTNLGRIGACGRVLWTHRMLTLQRLARLGHRDAQGIKLTGEPLQRRTMTRRVPPRPVERRVGRHFPRRNIGGQTNATGQPDRASTRLSTRRAASMWAQRFEFIMYRSTRPSRAALRMN